MTTITKLIIFLKEKKTKIEDVFFKKKRKKIQSKQFLTSEKYNKIMNKYKAKDDFLDSAEKETRNYRYRHKVKNKLLGAWRWAGVYQKKEELISFVFSEKKGLDFGGARGPISIKVDVCDWLEKDIFNRKVKYNDLNEIADNSQDFIWSSHTLEHIQNLDEIIKKIHTKLKKKGKLIILVPSYTCKRWRAGKHKYVDQKGDSSHKHTFCLSNDKKRLQKNYVNIDKVIEKNKFKIKQKEYVGDNSIYIFAEK